MERQADGQINGQTEGYFELQRIFNTKNNEKKINQNHKDLVKISVLTRCKGQTFG